MPTKFFRVPFALEGDVEEIPDALQSSGAVSFTTGYGFDYERDPAADPSAKDIERSKTNWMFSAITAVLRQYQTTGAYPFITAEENNGTAYPYVKGAQCLYSGAVYESLVDNNTALPTDAVKWRNKSEIVQDWLSNSVQLKTTAPLIGGGSLKDGLSLKVNNASETAVGVIQIATDAEAVAGTITTKAITPKQLGILRRNVGEVYFHQGRSAPFGAVVADGGLVRRDMYPDLWKFAQAQNLVITEADWQKQAGMQGAVGLYSAGDGVSTFRLPLLTDFFRGTKDPSKVGTWQGDAIRNITGTAYGDCWWSTVSASVAGTDFSRSTGAFKGVDPVSGYLFSAQTTNPTKVFNRGAAFDASSVVPTAPENRPKTLFLLPCIHAYDAVIPSAQADMHAMLVALNGKVDKTTYDACPIFLAAVPASSIPAATYTRLPLSSITIDTHGSYFGGNFKPQIPGYYKITASYMSLTIAAGGTHYVNAPKNGGIGMMVGSSATGPSAGSSVSTIMQLNGTTDYVSLYIYSSVASSIPDSYGLLHATLIRGI